MAINLEKGQRINLEKDGGQKLTNFCVGCNWGAIKKKTFFGLTEKNESRCLISLKYFVPLPKICGTLCL